VTAVTGVARITPFVLEQKTILVRTEVRSGHSRGHTTYVHTTYVLSAGCPSAAGRLDRPGNRVGACASGPAGVHVNPVVDENVNGVALFRQSTARRCHAAEAEAEVDSETAVAQGRARRRSRFAVRRDSESRAASGTPGRYQPERPAGRSDGP
jgi:hypothetical protein